MKRHEETTEFDNEFLSMETKISMTNAEQNDVLNQINIAINQKRTVRIQSPFQWKYYLAFTAALFIIMILSLPQLSNTFQTIAGGVNKEESFREILNELDYDKIVHQEKVENGVIVFYDPKIESGDIDALTYELSAIFINETLFGWKKTNDQSGFSSGINKEILSQFLPKHDSESPFPMLFGEILNPDLNQVKVINVKSNHEYKAEIVTKENRRIWFAFVDENQVDLYEVQGLSKSVNEKAASVELNYWEIDGSKPKDEFIDNDETVRMFVEIINNAEELDVQQVIRTEPLLSFSLGLKNGKYKNFHLWVTVNGKGYIQQLLPNKNGTFKLDEKSVERLSHYFKEKDNVKLISSEIEFDTSEEESLINFKLTNEEASAYNKMRKDISEVYIRELSPISIAKIYVKASLDREYEISYELYVDRNDIVKISREEYLNSNDHPTEEQVLQIFSGISEGTFIEEDDNHGNIKFNRMSGDTGYFAMIKDEDGIWNVSFMPIQ